MSERESSTMDSVHKETIGRERALMSGGVVTTFKATDVFKYLYDRHETCVHKGKGEANLHTHVQCLKNPGHKEFIPIDAFSLQHIPESLRDENTLKFLKLMFAFTVKIDVKYTSPHRPEFWEGSTVTYPFYDFRKRTVGRMGSGSIRGVYSYTRGYSSEGCPHWKLYTFCVCSKCRASDAPSQTWWEVEVMTATHVVYDEEEAGHTTCSLFYDRKGGQVIVLDAVTMDYANVETDKCWLRCVTCDPGLIQKLQGMSQEFDISWRQFYQGYCEGHFRDKLAIMASHPHGCSKQVSVGQWVERIKLDGEDDVSCYTYTTPTCPGSSGATIYFLGYHNGQRYMYSDHHVHSGVAKCGFNYCGIGFDL